MSSAPEPGALGKPEVRSSSRRREAALTFAALLSAVLAGHGLALRDGFVWDDVHTVVENPAFSGLGALWRALRMDDWQGYGLRARGVWRPLATVSLFLDHRLFGAAAVGFHAVNLLLHTAAACAVWAILRTLHVRRAPAIAAAMLFALHPLSAEPADWISARPDLLAVGLTLAALLAAISGRPFAAAALAALAPFGKEPGLLAVPATLAIVWTSPGARRRALGATAIACCGAAGYLVARHFAAVPSAIAARIAPAALGGLVRRIGDAAVGLAGALAWPVPLDACRRLRDSGALGTWAIAAAALLSAGAIAAAVRRRRGAPLALAMLVFGPLLLVALYDANLSERYLYLPLAATCIAAGLAVESLARRVPPEAGSRTVFALTTLLALLAVACIPIDAARATEWGSADALFAGAARVDPDNPDAFQLWGAALYRAGDRAGALAAFERAAELGSIRPGLHSNLCAVLRESGHLDRARAACDRAVTLDPQDPRPHYNRALMLAASGHIEEARRQLAVLVHDYPNYRPARRALTGLAAAVAVPASRGPGPDRGGPALDP